MTFPTYEWTCQKCLHTNVAHTGACAACGFSANFTVSQLQKELPAEEVIRRQTDKTKLSNAIWLFFPEVIPAAILLICAPIWAMKLISRGNFLAGAALLAGEVFAVWGFIRSLHRREKISAYLCMIGFLALAGLIDSSTPK